MMIKKEKKLLEIFVDYITPIFEVIEIYVYTCIIL